MYYFTCNYLIRVQFMCSGISNYYNFNNIIMLSEPTEPKDRLNSLPLIGFSILSHEIKVLLRPIVPRPNLRYS